MVKILMVVNSKITIFNEGDYPAKEKR